MPCRRVGGGLVGELGASRGEHGARAWPAPRRGLRATATPPRNGAGSSGADGGRGAAWLGRRASAGSPVGGAGRLAWRGRHGCTHPAGRPSDRVPAPLAPQCTRGGGCWAMVRVARRAGPQTPCTPALIPGPTARVRYGGVGVWLRGVWRVARRRAGRSVARRLARLLPEPRLFPQRAPPPARPPSRRRRREVPPQRALVGGRDCARRRRRPPNRTSRLRPRLPPVVSAVTLATTRRRGHPHVARLAREHALPRHGVAPPQPPERLLEVPQLRVARPLELGLGHRVGVEPLAQHSSSPSLQIRGTVLARQSVEINVAGSADFSDTIKSRIFFDIRTCFST